MNKIKKYINKVDKVMVGEIIIIGLMILPALLICWYSLPLADDFYNANLMRMNLENNGSWIKAASSIIIDFYKKGGGYVFSIIFSCLFTPLSRGGIEDLRKVIFIINSNFALE